VETISCIVTGRIGSAPRTGTTKNGKAWASFSLAADLPPRTAGGESETRWYTVWAYGPLAEHVSGSLVKGDMVTVRDDDITCRTWTDDRDPQQRPRAQAELRAYDVAASMRFEYLVTAKSARAGGELTAPAADGDPWAGEQAAPQREVPEVLAGVVTQPA
jgi:single-stranded DNA-binding protein